MSTPTPSSRETVLAVAERLFAERGYAGVTLRDISAELGIRQASLYYHAPGGKEELFVEVTVRHLERHREAMVRILEEEGHALEPCLRRIGVWMLGQPPMDLGRLIRSDLPHLSEPARDRVEDAVEGGIFRLLVELTQSPGTRERLRFPDGEWLAGAFLTMTESMHSYRSYIDEPIETVVAQMVDLLLHGALISETSPGPQS